MRWNRSRKSDIVVDGTSIAIPKTNLLKLRSCA